MGFNLQEALKAGHTKGDILNFLSQKHNFDLAGAQGAGHSDDDILNILVDRPKTQTFVPEQFDETEFSGIGDLNLSSLEETPTPAQFDHGLGTFLQLSQEERKAQDLIKLQKAKSHIESLGKTVVGGGLDLTRAVLPIGIDIVAAFGDEKAEKLASDLRSLIPDIPPETTAQDIGQKLIQFGIPARSALKLTQAATQGSKWAIRFMSGIMAGGFADFFAAGPEEGTIGDILGGPTMTMPGEKALTRKLKVAAEGVAVPLGIQTTAGAAKIAKHIAVRVGQIASPGRFVKKVVSQALIDQSIDPELALKKIQEGLLGQVEGGFSPTTGTLSQDPGLIGLEKGISAKGAAQEGLPSFSAEFLARSEFNLEAISKQLDTVVENLGGDGQRAKLFFDEFVSKTLEGKTNALELAQRAVKSIEDETDNLIHEFALQGGRQADASSVIDDTVRNELERITAQKNAFLDAIDPGNEVVIPRDRLRDAFKKMITRTSRADTTPSKIPGKLKATLRKLLKQKGKELTFGELQDVRPDLSEAIAKARANNKGGVVKRLSEFKKAFTAETDFLAAAGNEAGKRAKKAIKYFKEQYVPRFKEGVGSQFRKAIRSGTPFPPTATGKRFLEAASGSSEAANQLKLIVDNAPIPAAGQNAVREHLISSVADLMQGANGKTSLKRLDSFLNRREVRESLSQFPGIRSEINQFRNSIIKGVEKSSRLGQQVERAQIALAKTDKQLKRSAARFFVDKEPVKAIGSVLQSADPVKNMKELVSLARKDTTGDALKGLQQSLSDYIDQTSRTTKEIAGSFEVSRAKIHKMLTNKSMRSAIGELYTPQQMATLDNLHSQLNIMDRINKQVMTGSPTAQIQQNIQRARVVLASMYGIVKGRGIFAISGWIAKLLGIDPVAKANLLIKDAMLNPELAATLMTKVSETAKPRISSRITSHLINNLVTQEQK